MSTQTQIEAQAGPTTPDENENSPPLIPINLPRNFIGYTGDMMSFMIGINFIPASIVLVAFASKLTTNQTLIGVVGAIGSITWFLPQLFAAKIIHGKRRKKPYLMAAALIGRQGYLLIIGWLVITQAVEPIITILILLISITIFHVSDALAGIAWFDMLSRALSPRMRSRSIALGELVGSILGIGSGVAVERILAPDGLLFPYNYALIIACAWFFFNISFLFLLLLKENPMDEAERSQSTESQFGSHLWRSITTDKSFRRLMLARLLTGVEAMAAPFYVVFIKSWLHLPDSSIGGFAIAYAVGSIAGIIFFGGVADRFGARRVIHAASIMQFMGPALATLVALMTSINAMSSDIALAAFTLIQAIIGALTHALLLGFVGYTLDASPERHRAMHVGVVNTIGGIVSVMPILAGVLIDVLLRAASLPLAYGVVFGIAAVCVGAGVVLCLRLPRLAMEHDRA